MKSLRLRLALLAGAIAAALAFGAGYYAWRLSVQFNLDRLDRELRSVGAANLERVVGDEHWRRVESALRFVSGADRPPAFALWVENHGRELYRSPHWPRELAPASMPKLAAYEGGATFETLPSPPRSGEPLSPRNPPLPRKEPRFLSERADGSAWRIAVMGSPYTTLVLAARMDDFNADLDRLRLAFMAGAVAVLLVVGSAGWWLAGRALRPVHALTASVNRVTARGLDQRLPATGYDREFQTLVAVFNQMMDRLERSFHQATRFSGDASHELKTPLARLQAEIEQALAGAPPGSAQEQTFTSLLEEVQRLKAIVQKLLLLALADSGRLDLHREDIDLSELLGNVIEDSTQLATGLEIVTAVEPGIRVLADPILLEQALQNLASNALKYNRPGGRIEFSLKTMPTATILSVGNTGAGIAPADQPRVFERFFRGDTARTGDQASGTGLGLSLSREIVRAHEGDLILHRSEADWTEFQIVLPRTSASQKKSVQAAGA